MKKFHLFLLGALLSGEAALSTAGIAAEAHDEAVGEDMTPFPEIDSRQIQFVGVRHIAMGGPTVERTADGRVMMSSGGPALRSGWGPFCRLETADAIAMVEALRLAAPANDPGGFAGGLLIVIVLDGDRQLDVRVPARGDHPALRMEVGGHQYTLDRASLQRVQDIADRGDCVQRPIPDELRARIDLLTREATLPEAGTASATRDGAIEEDLAPFPAIESRQIAAVGIHRLVMSGPISLRTPDGGARLTSGGRATRPVWGRYCPLGHDDAIAVVQALGWAVPGPAGSRGFGGNLLVAITLADGRQLNVRAPDRGTAAPFGLELDGRQYLLDRTTLARVQDIADRADCVRRPVPDLPIP